MAKTDKDKLFEAFEKICGIKIIEESENKELIEEGWKNWAVALGIVASSFFSQNVKADSINNIKDKVENVISKDTTLKKLKKDGFAPEIGEYIDSSRKISDSNIQIVANTQTAAKIHLIQILKSKGINPSDNRAGFIVYKNENKNVIAKYIKYI
jgi:hypothetical protein